MDFKIKLAEIPIQVHSQYDSLKEYCKDYVVEESENRTSDAGTSQMMKDYRQAEEGSKNGLEIVITPDDIERERENVSFRLRHRSTRLRNPLGRKRTLAAQYQRSTERNLHPVPGKRKQNSKTNPRRIPELPAPPDSFHHHPRKSRPHLGPPRQTPNPDPGVVSGVRYLQRSHDAKL